MNEIRVIPCLDVSAGRVVKGVNFANLRDAGDPAELAARYSEEGADEITFLDVSATNEHRLTTLDAVRETVRAITVPLTVGGGVRSVEDARRLLDSGASRVSVSTAALGDPELLTKIANEFGSESLVLSLDARRVPDGDLPYRYEVTTHGGTRSAGVDAEVWAGGAAKRGVGQILLNSMDSDGVQTGFDLEMLEAIRSATDLPIIASGGAGKVEDFVDAVKAGANAVLAASVFHFGTVSVSQVKKALSDAGFSVNNP